MKKIYYLLLICLTVTSLGYGQTDITIGSQSFEGNGTWTYTTTPNPIDDANTQWGIYDDLGHDFLQATDGTYFFGLHNQAKTPPSRLNYNLEFSNLDISDYDNVIASFDYGFFVQNANFNPTFAYQIYVDGEEFVSETLASDAVGAVSTDAMLTISHAIPANSNTLAIYIQVVYPANFANNTGRAVFAFDNFKAVSENGFSGLVYLNDTDGWLNNDLPEDNPGANALILDGTYSINSTITLGDVITENGAGISITPQGSLNVNNITTANNLVLNSSSTAYASLTASGTVTGLATYNRHVNQADGNDLIATPFEGQTFGDFASNNSNLALAGEGTDANIKRFGPFEKTTGNYAVYSLVANTSTPVTRGVGYRSATTDNGSLSFTGTVLTGNKTTPVSYFGSTYASQWNLIGNPYPAYLSIDAFLSNSTNAPLFQAGKTAVYGYNGDVAGGWNIYNLSSGINMTPGQGFYVAVSSTTGSANMAFTPSMIIANATGDDFIAGRTQNINKSHFKLALSTGETLQHTSDVYFNDIATLGLDEGYDATIYGNNYTGFTLFTQLAESNPNFKIGIQTLPNENLAEGVAIPLGIIAPKGQQITLDILESTLSETATVYLEDTKTNTWTLISSEPYIFTTDEKLTGVGRFILHTTDQERLGVEDNLIDQIQIFTGNNSIKVKGQLDKNTTLAIYDIQGRLIKNTTIAKTVNEYIVNTTGFSSGIYIVKIANNIGNQISKRVILK